LRDDARDERYDGARPPSTSSERARAHAA
jgi:hypothetical protein